MARLFDRFELQGSLATGGMGEVLLAVDRADDRATPVVIKRMHRHLASEEAAVRMFRHEVRILRQMQSPQVPRVVHSTEAEWTIAMEFVDGVPLARAIERGVPYAPGAVVAIVTQLLDVLTTLHELNDEAGAPLAIVHRDVCPANVIVAREGDVHLVDFGVSTSAWREADRGDADRGTAGYIAPEVIRGEQVDARADLFAASVIAWELLNGERLFGGGRIASMHATVEGDAPRMSAPKAMGEVIARGLARTVNERWATARAMREALERAARDDGIVADRAGAAASVRVR